MKRTKNPEAFFYRLLAAHERGIIDAALTSANWNRKLTASALGISYRSLLYKIEQHGLTEFPQSASL